MEQGFLIWMGEVTKTKAAKRELEICGRLRKARELLDLTQEACAGQIGLQRGSLVNYEIGRTPLKHEIALRFCHQFIVSEEWLATGHTAMMQAEAKRLGVGVHPSMETIFRRQSMDLITEPICRRIPPGELYSVAFDKFLAPIYGKLVERFFYVPRTVYSESDPPSRNMHIVQAYVERWLKMLGNEALRQGKSQAEVQVAFTESLVKAGGLLFRDYAGAGLDADRLREFLSRLAQESSAMTAHKN